MTPLRLEGDHVLQLLQQGSAYFPALQAAIDASTTEVRMETYLWAFDTWGEAIAQALERAAQRGVVVTVVMDGVGTDSVPVAWQQRWDAAGVQWRRFSPLGTLGLLVPSRWRRLHRKLCVVDQRVGFCGGINVLDDWDDPNHGPQPHPRFDFAVRIEGPLVKDIHTAVLQFWQRMQVAYRLEHGPWSSPQQAWKAARALVPRWQRRGAAPSADTRPALAALVLRDNVRHRRDIERAYRRAIGEAQHEVLIANAYFLPGGKLRRALLHAAQRGVRVRLLLQGRYEYFMQYHAARPLYGALLAAGVEIYEYTPGFLHAKVAVVDGQWATVGSSNLDPLSLLLAREANVVVQDSEFAQTLQARLEAAITEHGVALQPDAYAQRPWRQRLLDTVAYGAMRLMLFLTGRRY